MWGARLTETTGSGAKRRRQLAHYLRTSIARQGGLCALCSRPFTARWPATLDHIVPRASGGTWARMNLQAAHKPCNELKANMSMFTFERAVADGRLRLPELPEGSET